MEFNETIKQFAKRVEELKDNVQTEEATKMSLIVPFFQILGYDIFNPSEFCPEYTADVGIKKGEKVDYAIIIDGEPIILIEAKSVSKKLDRHSSQLFRYFVTTSSKFAILTNGIFYKFYTDLDETNKMDREPFWDIDLLHLKETDIIQLDKFRKQNLSISDILDTASLLKYTNTFKKLIEQQFLEPSDEFVKLFLQSIYKGTKTQNVLEKFRPILKKSLNDFLNEKIGDKLQLALKSTQDTSANTLSKIPTDEEFDFLTKIKEILQETVDTSKISIKYTESYTAIIYDNNVRKWICRLSSSSTQKTLIFPDENKKEIRIILSDIDHINNYSKELIKIATRYIVSVSLPPTETLYTKWGNYEMPDPYKISFTRGVRNDLKKNK